MTIGEHTSPGAPVVMADPGAEASDPRQVIELLEAYVPADAQQAEVRRMMLAFLHEHPDALDRTCAPGHFTASALVVADDAERFVVLHHTKLRRWLQPGGHVDGSSNMAAAAWREATEETGLEGLAVVVPVVDLDIHRVEPPAEAPHDHLDLRFVVLAPAGAELAGNHESTDIRWATPDDIDALDVDDGLRRLVRNGLAMARRVTR